MAIKQRKNPEKDRAVALTPNEEDLAWAEAQNRGTCIISRCIQRTMTDATRVIVTTKTISFTLDRDDYRYTFPTPDDAIENFIKPLDTGQEVKLGETVYLVNPISAEPRQRRTQAELEKYRANQRRSNRRVTAKTKNVSVKQLNRFRDAETQFTLDNSRKSDAK